MIENVVVSPYGSGTGLLVQPRGTERDLSVLSPVEVVRALGEAGFLLFRGFDSGLEEFSAFVESHSERVTLDPARSFHGGSTAQKVDAGYDAVGLHLENGNSPFAPTLTWFYCQKAAAEGSQTTVCDGYRVWDALSEGTRSLFASQDIVYTRRVEEAKWKGFAAFHLGTADADSVTVEQLRDLARGEGKTVIEPVEDGAVRYAYRIPAVHGTLFGARPAFANSILGPSNHYEKPRITFTDGNDIPASVLAELEKVTDAQTEQLDWVDGDIALIDNTRVMHGRRPIVDARRTIFNAQSDMDTELLAA
ncbi:TauD/TfdA family dioxygenase [Streptomyces piniterrae]|uniref:TauD/TfdA family dioxygenase n=1 Tax=Streptomyces piniterrae TaxID=2571125 RepID=UPI00145FA97A|nr:TauD/TfdA family dioxygenase [Streptomyces piniterrae]